MFRVSLAALQLSPGQNNEDGGHPDGSVYAGVERQLDVVVPRSEMDIVIDGSLDDDAWSGAAVLSGFSQYKPVDGVPADDPTEVLIWYSTSAIHFGIRAYEPHGAVNATLADRDNIENDDHVQILLDTFNDGRRSLAFAVNPLGIQSDGARIEEGSGSGGGGGSRRGPSDPVDLAPDFLYESRGRNEDSVQDPLLSARRATGLGHQHHPTSTALRPRADVDARTAGTSLVPVPRRTSS